MGLLPPSSGSVHCTVSCPSRVPLCVPAGGKPNILHTFICSQTVGWLWSHRELQTVLLCKTPTPVLGPTNPPIQRVSELLSLRVKRLDREADSHIHAVLRCRLCGSVPPLSALRLRDMARNQASLRGSRKGNVGLFVSVRLSALNGPIFVKFCNRDFY